jgi:hypothetical protein
MRDTKKEKKIQIQTANSHAVSEKLAIVQTTKNTLFVFYQRANQSDPIHTRDFGNQQITTCKELRILVLTIPAFLFLK